MLNVHYRNRSPWWQRVHRPTEKTHPTSPCHLAAVERHRRRRYGMTSCRRDSSAQCGCDHARPQHCAEHAPASDPRSGGSLSSWQHTTTATQQSFSAHTTIWHWTKRRHALHTWYIGACHWKQAFSFSSQHHGTISLLTYALFHTAPF